MGSLRCQSSSARRVFSSAADFSFESARFAISDPVDMAIVRIGLRISSRRTLPIDCPLRRAMRPSGPPPIPASKSNQLPRCDPATCTASDPFRPQRQMLRFDSCRLGGPRNSQTMEERVSRRCASWRALSSSVAVWIQRWPFVCKGGRACPGRRFTAADNGDAQGRCFPRAEPTKKFSPISRR